MQISLSIPFDEQRMRRTVKFIIKPQMRSVRLCGAVILVIGALIVPLDPSNMIGYTFAALGLAFLLVVPPLTVTKTVNLQSKLAREGLHMTLDDELLTVTHPLVESRIKWAAFARVVETPEVWYLMSGKAQAITIPKNSMTEEQLAEFAGFLKTQQPAPQGV